MADTIIAKMKGFLLNPVETFKASRDDSPGTVFTYFGIILLVYAILSAVITAITFTALSALGMISSMIPGFTPGLGMLMPVIVFICVIIGGIIGTIIFGAWLHLWVYIFDGRQGIMQTIKAVMYGHTPFLLFGWIPLISFIFAIWTLILDIFGVRELCGLSTGRAVTALVVAIVIPVLIIAILVVLFIMPAMMSAYSPGLPRAGY